MANLHPRNEGGKTRWAHFILKLMSGKGRFGFAARLTSPRWEELEGRGEKKEKAKGEKNGITVGFEGRIWIKFPNSPDPKKLRGGWRGIDLTGN